MELATAAGMWAIDGWVDRIGGRKVAAAGCPGKGRAASP